MKVLDGSNTVAEYEYDGSNRRIVKKTYTSGSLTETRHYYHTPNQNQVLEERVGSSTNAERQYTWNPGYIDSLLLRKRDTNADGTLDETLYPLTDATYDVVALADTSGTIVERFLYDPYGKSTVLDANFAVDSDGVSDYDWEYRFTSREFDRETGLDYFRARYYSSGQGRFVNRDPIGYPDGMNAYAGYFVPNRTDPLGQSVPITKNQCENAVKTLTVLEDSPLKTLIDKVNKACGELPKIECAESNGRKVDAVHNREQKTITIFFDNLEQDRDFPVGIEEYFTSAIAHELIHSFDACTSKHEKPLDCRELMCNELRAYSCSENCDNKSDSRHQNVKRPTCIYRGTIASAKGHPVCKNEVMSGTLDDLYETVAETEGCMCKKECPNDFVPPDYPKW